RTRHGTRLEDGMSSLLEQRYRHLLSFLPAEYRQGREEDMVATYLDAAHAEAPDDPDGVDLRRPTWPEAAAVLRLAARLRLGAPGGTPASHVWGEALRRVALIGMLVHVASAINWPVAWLAARAPQPEEAGPAGWQGGVDVVVALLWAAAYLSA